MEKTREAWNKPLKYGQLIFNKSSKEIQQKKNGLSTNGTMKIEYPHAKINK